VVRADATGFRTSTRDGQARRVYTIVEPGLGGQVTVGDSQAIRDQLVRDVIAGFLWPALVVLPVIWGLIWLSITTGLAPLARFARDLEARRTDDLGALPEPKLRPREIRPLAGALNDLLARLARARAQERDFIAYAAHEMKTPLAGLKTQAHIASRAQDQATRARALEAISTSVDRTDRMVHQLLDLAQVDSRETRLAPIALQTLLRQVLGDLAEVADRRQLHLALELPTQPVTLASDPFLLAMALRNLIENAIQASPKGSGVLVRVSDTGADALIDIRDSGPGLPPAIAQQAQEKFVKGNNVDPSGSGLGLAIATDAMTAVHGAIRFEQQADGHHTIMTLPQTGPGVLSQISR
jgi:two-component system sensor histidine kinase QseC